MKADVTLWLPGAISPNLALANNKMLALAKLLSRANKHQKSGGVEQTLKTYFEGLPREIPSGALAALAEGMIANDNRQIWCSVSPMACMLSHQSVVICEAPQLNPQEMTEITQRLNDHLKADNLQLKLVNETQWSCQVSEHTDVVMNSLVEALHQNMLHYLPSGPHQVYWRRLLTECQMLLQNCAVNEKRAQSDLPLISVWFSGLGPLPDKVKTKFDLIYTNDSMLKGLALCAGCEVQAMDANVLNNLAHCQKKKILIADFDLYRLLKQQDETAWLTQLMHYENNWFSPLIKAIETNKIERLSLDFNDGNGYYIMKKHLKYFWRKIRTLSSFA